MADFKVGDRVRVIGDGAATIVTRIAAGPENVRTVIGWFDPTELELVERAHYAPPGVTLVPLANNVLDVLAEAMKRAEHFQGIHHEVIDDIVRRIDLAEFYASAAFDAGEARGVAMVAMTADRIDALDWAIAVSGADKNPNGPPCRELIAMMAEARGETP